MIDIPTLTESQFLMITEGRQYWMVMYQPERQFDMEPILVQLDLAEMVAGKQSGLYNLPKGAPLLRMITLEKSKWTWLTIRQLLSYVSEPIPPLQDDQDIIFLCDKKTAKKLAGWHESAVLHSSVALLENQDVLTMLERSYKGQTVTLFFDSTADLNKASTWAKERGYSRAVMLGDGLHFQGFLSIPGNTPKKELVDLISDVGVILPPELTDDTSVVPALMCLGHDTWQQRNTYYWLQTLMDHVVFEKPE